MVRLAAGFGDANGIRALGNFNGSLPGTFSFGPDPFILSPPPPRHRHDYITTVDGPPRLGKNGALKCSSYVGSLDEQEGSQLRFDPFDESIAKIFWRRNSQKSRRWQKYHLPRPSWPSSTRSRRSSRPTMSRTRETTRPARLFALLLPSRSPCSCLSLFLPQYYISIVVYPSTDAEDHVQACESCSWRRAECLCVSQVAAQPAARHQALLSAAEHIDLGHKE